MPFYRGTIYKRHNEEPNGWTNVYTINQPGNTTAMAALEDIMDAEIAVHYADTEFYRLVVVNKANSSDRLQVDTTQFGALSLTGMGGILPLFNTVRVVFSDGIKRPESKYLRLPGNEANLENGHWSGELVDFVQTNYADVLVALVAYVGPSGETITAGTVKNKVQMRQLGWSRRTRPGFKRGWVAV